MLILSYSFVVPYVQEITVFTIIYLPDATGWQAAAATQG